LKAKIATVFKTKTRDEWCAIMEGSDVCFAPVLNFDEAPQHPHNRARGTFVDIAGITQPAPAPRFNRTAPSTPSAPPKAGQHTDAVLSEWGFSSEDVKRLRDCGAVS
jgi:alpha-methylacyl-CoA racemase